ncbi:hypothetical protein [Iningainema tapete]|uniref:Uncharacterized protein n=1 Tax=Iningainema tapete BLCC-T55 TaxID=2748662 RepID=A0A8J6XNB4_9CYAN|nr:hypothetical protein [Iningainema tapete]MBD2773542.1 hypothetical protein [Iningainema tapete BLCC-T55]
MPVNYTVQAEVVDIRSDSPKKEDKAGIVKIITDDGDYVTVPGIKVFTANIGAIAAAGSQGKLRVR